MSVQQEWTERDQSVVRGRAYLERFAEHELARAPADSAEPPGPAERPEPEPLRRPLPPAEPYPLDQLGNILGPAARAIDHVVQAPDAITGAALLCAASLAAMPHADVHVDGRRILLSIWAVSIAESGDRKSAVDELALRRHRAAERERAKLYDRQRGELAAARAAASADVDDEPPPEPLLPWLLASDPTVEGLHRLLAEGYGYGGLISDDGGDMIGGHSMNRDNRMRTAAALSHLFDRGEYDRVRGRDGAHKYYGRRLAFHLMIQGVVAETLLSDPVLTGQGCLARCLLAWPVSRAGTRRYVERDLGTDPAMVAYWSRMGDLLDRPLPLAEGERNELDPRALRLTPAAKELWIAAANGIEASTGPDSPLSGIRAWASKGADQILRVAGVLTLVSDPDATQIDRDTVEQAGELVAWHLGEAARIVGTASVPLAIRHAEAILAWAREHGLAETHSRHVLRLGPGCVRTSVALREAMAVLVRHGYAECLEPGSVVDGAPRRAAWRFCRATS